MSTSPENTSPTTLQEEPVHSSGQGFSGSHGSNGHNDSSGSHGSPGPRPDPIPMVRVPTFDEVLADAPLEDVPNGNPNRIGSPGFPGSNDDNGCGVPVEAEVLSYEQDDDREAANADAEARSARSVRHAYEDWCRARKLYDEYMEELLARSEGSFHDVDLNATDASDLISYRSAGIYTIDEMEAEITRAGKQPYLVDGYVPIQSITLTVGNSGDGKSPLKYQQGICIAAGVPFLGLRVTPGRVLYIDFENSLEQSIGLAKDIARVLGLSEVPPSFRIWNAALSSDTWQGIVPKLVNKFKPMYVVIDTMSKAFPSAEDNNKAANEMLSALKQLTSAGCSVDIIHHLKKSSSAGQAGAGTKPSIDPKTWQTREASPDEPDIQELIKDSRGAGALYNGSDVRFLTRKPPSTQSKQDDGTCEVQLLGFRRVLGTLPTIFLDRVCDEDTGKPLGYTRLVGTRQFSNPTYAKIFEALPETFRWKDLEKPFGKSGRSKQLFKDVCIGIGVVEPLKDGKGYQKVEAAH